MKEFKGKLLISNARIGIVVARFNELVTKSLLNGALETLERLGIHKENISIAWVPGAFEIPLTAQTMAETNNFDAIVCLGAVIRGATPHFDFVAGQAAAGIAKIALENKIPVIFGVLTTDTIEQALERAGTKAGNKGAEAAESAIEMISLLQQIEGLPTHQKTSQFSIPVKN